MYSSNSSASRVIKLDEAEFFRLLSLDRRCESLAEWTEVGYCRRRITAARSATGFVRRYTMIAIKLVLENFRSGGSASSAIVLNVSMKG